MAQMLDRPLQNCILEAKVCRSIIINSCPQPGRNKYSKGALLASIKMFTPSIFYFEITVGGEAVNYMPYTNEPWISPRWNGKRNPNQNWWDLAIQQYCVMTAERNRGVFINDRK